MKTLALTVVKYNGIHGKGDSAGKSALQLEIVKLEFLVQI